RGRMLVELHNYVTNPLNSSAIDPFTAQITSLTPGVTTATRRIVNYPAVAPGESAFGDKPFRFTIAGTFVPGTPIIFRLRTINNGKAGAVLYIKLSNTGTPEETTILTEDFESVAPGSLPAGWSSIHGAGNNDVPWTTTSTFCGPTNAAFHPNANDGLSGDPSRWERLSSPLITVPADAEYVTLDMDVCYNTEEDPLYQRLAYDGFFLRITDYTASRTVRSVLVEAFADQFTTDNFKHYPRHFPWGTGLANYFEDMSAWAGNSGGAVHTRMRLPGMAGSDVRLRFEYTQDTFSTCQDVRPGTNCGVWVDNIVMKGVKSAQ
ncbi:MAG: hypothetical protein HYX76_14400, partial [Acidobacteria bacterium]|nr:hypothetical protein [Acidobacteriota bacterium]